MNKEIMIGNHKISEDSPTFVIAEMSANHLMDFDRAVAIMQAAKDAGADAIKIQTYTPDTITLDCDDPCFQITQGTIWDGTTLHKLYETAYTPWEWQPKLKKIAEEMGLVFFSSPFDLTSIDFLEEMEVPVYKVASFEINDIPFIRKIARTGKPIIMSTGIAYLADIELALRTCKEEGNENVILLKCTSAYPAPYEDINLKTIPSMKEVFDCVVGLSDHTMGCAVAGAGVALGAKVVEKHLTLRRADGGADVHILLRGFLPHIRWTKPIADYIHRRYHQYQRLLLRKTVPELILTSCWLHRSRVCPHRPHTPVPARYLCFL